MNRKDEWRAVYVFAFGSEVASNLQIPDGVGVTPSSAEQIQHGDEAAQNMTDARLQALSHAIEMGSLEGEIPADLEKGVDSAGAKDIAMDRLDSEYVQQGDWDTTGQTQSGTTLVYVPYDFLPDGYKDTYTRGAEKEDLKLRQLICHRMKVCSVFITAVTLASNPINHWI